jgi:hypothetical protein
MPQFISSAQIERIMHDLQGAVGVFLADDATDPDLAGGDVPDVDLSLNGLGTGSGPRGHFSDSRAIRVGG